MKSWATIIFSRRTLYHGINYNIYVKTFHTVRRSSMSDYGCFELPLLMWWSMSHREWKIWIELLCDYLSGTYTFFFEQLTLETQHWCVNNINWLVYIRLISHGPMCGQVTMCQLQTHKWLNRMCVALMSQAGAESPWRIFPHQTLCLYSFWALLLVILMLVEDSVLLHWPSHKEASQLLAETATTQPQLLIHFALLWKIL